MDNFVKSVSPQTALSDTYLTDIQSIFSKLNQHDTNVETKRQLLSRVKQIVSHLELEVHGNDMIEPMEKERLLNQLTLAKRDYKQWEGKIERLAYNELLLKPTDQFVDDEELHTANEEEPLMGSTDDIMKRSAERLQMALRSTSQSESMALDAMNHLSMQRETLSRTRDRLGEMNIDLAQSGSTLSRMQWRRTYHKAILICIILILCAFIALIIYFGVLKPLIT